MIVWGTDRQHAIKRAQRAFEEFTIEGVKTTIPLHKKILANKDFQNANYDTSFIDGLLNK